MFFEIEYSVSVNNMVEQAGCLAPVKWLAGNVVSVQFDVKPSSTRVSWFDPSVTVRPLAVN